MLSRCVCVYTYNMVEYVCFSPGLCRCYCFCWNIQSIGAQWIQWWWCWWLYADDDHIHYLYILSLPTAAAAATRWRIFIVNVFVCVWVAIEMYLLLLGKQNFGRQTRVGWICFLLLLLSLPFCHTYYLTNRFYSVLLLLYTFALCIASRQRKKETRQRRLYVFLFG